MTSATPTQPTSQHRQSPSASSSSSIGGGTVLDLTNQGCGKRKGNCRCAVTRECLQGFDSQGLKGLHFPGRQQVDNSWAWDAHGTDLSSQAQEPPGLIVARVQAAACRGGGWREGTWGVPGSQPPLHHRIKSRKRPNFQHTQEKIYIKVDVFSNGFLLRSSLFSLCVLTSGTPGMALLAGSPAGVRHNH